MSAYDTPAPPDRAAAFHRDLRALVPGLRFGQVEQARSGAVRAIASVLEDGETETLAALRGGLAAAVRTLDEAIRS